MTKSTPKINQGKRPKRKAPSRKLPIPASNLNLLNYRIEDFGRESTPKNTEKAYLNDIDCYLNWGGPLPASPEWVARYLAAHAQVHKVTTLRRRKAMIARWHRDKGLNDPTQTEIVRRTIKGIARLYNQPPNKKKPISIRQVERLYLHLTKTINNAPSLTPQKTKALRDRAMLAVGFWGCLRSHELVDLQVRHIKITQHHIRIYNPYTKTDKEVVGREKYLASLPKMCPVVAVREYLKAANPRESLFPHMTPKGELGFAAIKSSSIHEWLQSLCKKANVRSSNLGSHSLRRGFATWYAKDGDLWGLMAAGDWKDTAVAAGYVDQEINIKQIRKRLKSSI